MGKNYVALPRYRTLSKYSDAAIWITRRVESLLASRSESLYSILYTCGIYSRMGHFRTPCHCWSSLRNSSWNILCCDWNIVRIQRSGSCAVRRIWLALVNWYCGGKHIRTSINILEVVCAVRLSSWDNYWTYSRSRVMGHIIRTCYHIWDTARLDSFSTSAPNQYIYDISGHFQSLYPIIIGGSLVFHIIYGSLLGFIAGRMKELGSFLKK